MSIQNYDNFLSLPFIFSFFIFHFSFFIFHFSSFILIRHPMKTARYIFTICILASAIFPVHPQTVKVTDDYLILMARTGDPLFTTYTAAIDRSRLYGDKGYKMDYYLDCDPLNYGSEQGGRFYTLWEINDVVVNRMAEYYRKPVVVASFPDLVILEYEPWQDIQVTETFFVYSSTMALVDMLITNRSALTHKINLYPVLEIRDDSLYIDHFDTVHNGYLTTHYETKHRLISDLRAGYPYPDHLRDFFAMNVKAYSYGGYTGGMKDFYNTVKTDFYTNRRSDSLNLLNQGKVDFVSLQAHFTLNPGDSIDIRYFRGIQDRYEDPDDLIRQAEGLNYASLQPYVDDDVRLFSQVPRIAFKTREEKMVYLSAFNLVRGCMLPPTGKTDYNFYVFSREPIWGWGHGHQVLHESLSMMAYAYLDPLSAEGSQRVYIEQQRPDGLIAYRHGPRGIQDYQHYSGIYHDTMPTTSAPFFSWINWEVFEVSHDTQFLKDAYTSGAKYVEWLLKNRDSNHDSLLEWGPYGIIENVRDWYNAVFQVSADRYLDVDKEDISDELDCLDLNLMVINEMHYLSKMAAALDRTQEIKGWQRKADDMTVLVNKLMWDESSHFFYSINRLNHSFFFMNRDLRRQEIIGLLPLWAEAVTPGRAALLVKTMTDTSKFWRKYGVPTLSAADPWYSPYVDYCCKWNGPVWLLWDYMVFDGLMKYGYDDLARQLAGKMMLAVTTQLTKNHNFWESYSPDNEVLNCPTNYIWDAIMAKLLIRVYQK